MKDEEIVRLLEKCIHCECGDCPMLKGAMCQEMLMKAAECSIIAKMKKQKGVRNERDLQRSKNDQVKA